MKKPNFFIIGAPKCGTTSLAAWLAEHPQIFMSPIKEPQFFNKDVGFPMKSLQAYEKLFKDASSGHIAVGEATVLYLYSKVAVRNILDYNPDAKFIVCLRNPVDMAYSLHEQWFFNGIEDIEDFKEAWLMQDIERGRHRPHDAMIQSCCFMALCVGWANR